MFSLAWTKVRHAGTFAAVPLLNFSQHPSDGRALLVNVRRAIVLHHHNFKKAVKAIQFSPDGKYFATSRCVKVEAFQRWNWLLTVYAVGIELPLSSASG